MDGDKVSAAFPGKIIFSLLDSIKSSYFYDNFVSYNVRKIGMINIIYTFIISGNQKLPNYKSINVKDP